MANIKEIGIINSLTQLVTLGLYSGGAIFLLPLALIEITGWVMLGLWIGLNFLVLPIIIKITESLLDQKVTSYNIQTGIKIVLTGLLGGLTAFIFYLIYYRFHMDYIDKEFRLSDYYSNLLPIFATMGLGIIIGEIIGRIRKAHTANRL